MRFVFVVQVVCPGTNSLSVFEDFIKVFFNIRECATFIIVQSWLGNLILCFQSAIWVFSPL